MAARRRILLKAVMWIVLATIALIILLVVTFYLGRGVILSRFLEHINSGSPGEVTMEQVRLIPLRDFPDAVFQFREVNVFERREEMREEEEEAIISLGEVYVSVSVADLLRGQIRVRDLRLGDGFIFYEVYPDSLSNLERALGERWSAGNEQEADEGDMGINLEHIEFNKLNVIFKGHGEFGNVRLRRLSSRVAYQGQLLSAGLELEMDVINFMVRGVHMDSRREVQLESELLLDQNRQKLEIEPSILQVAGIELHVGGSYLFGDDPRIDMEFEAMNTGLDLLNFLLLGILDMEEVRQSEEGSMVLEGTVKGSLKDAFPVVSVRGSVRDVGLQLQSIDREISEISFDLSATTGSAKDLREARVRLSGFSALSDEGVVQGNISASDLANPVLDVDVEGSVDMQGMSRMLKTELFKEMSGRLDIKADLRGRLDPASDVFLDSSSILLLEAQQVGLVMEEDSITDMNGSLYLRDDAVGSSGLSLEYNGQKALVSLEVSNLLPYFLGYDRDLAASLLLQADSIQTAQVLKDSSLISMLGDEIRDLHLKAGSSIRKEEMDRFLKQDSIPELTLTVEQFALRLPAYADIAEVEADLCLNAETLDLRSFKGRIGESTFHLSGRADHYFSLFQKSTGENATIQGRLSSPMVRAVDLFEFKGDFLLPETYRSEYLEDFMVDARLQLPSGYFSGDSVSLEFQVEVLDAGWSFHHYPLNFKHFGLKLERKGTALLVEDFRGEVGHSSFSLGADLRNLGDSLAGPLGGKVSLESDLLDLNELLNYDQSVLAKDEASQAPRLDHINYPDMEFLLDIGELRYGENRIFGMKGDLRTSSDKILYLDHLETSVKSGGSIVMDGQFNVSNAAYYNFSADLNMTDVDLQDLNVELKSGDEVFRLDRNFAGLVSADGLAEIFLTPDLKLDMTTTTAMFNVVVSEGQLNNFTPLYAAGKFLGSQSLDSVRFSNLYNRFTLMDSRVFVPLMIVESNVGQLLIEGEQGLDGSYLYLLRIPTWLVREAAFGRIAGPRDEDEDEIKTMKKGLFMKLTPWSDGTESGVRLGDKRDKYGE